MSSAEALNGALHRYAVWHATPVAEFIGHAKRRCSPYTIDDTNSRGIPMFLREIIRDTNLTNSCTWESTSIRRCCHNLPHTAPNRRCILYLPR